MINKFFNKTISIILTTIFLFGLFPSMAFAQPSSSLQGEIKGFNKTIFDNSFSRADREINPDLWLTEAKLGLNQAICSWELIAVNFYEDPFLFDEAKNQIINWSNKELETRFSNWLFERFFGEAAEKVIFDINKNLKDTQKGYSWHLDNNGNVIFDNKTGNSLIVHESSDDINKWKLNTKNIINTASASLDNIITQLFPELLAYIPSELRDNISALIYETAANKKSEIKREFENIAAREERIFSSKRNKDLWNLNNKVINKEVVKSFTDNLITETEKTCKTGIEELNIRIEQAEAGIGDLALLGDEWLRLYKEQFEKGLRAWEEAEERFFIRRIEWEQDSFKLFSDGEDVWLAAFNEFEEERKKWELNAKELLESGEKHFINLSEEFEKNILDAKKEFELNMNMRLGEGTTKAEALIDMYLTFASTALSIKEAINFWQIEYGFIQKDPIDSDFMEWLNNEMMLIWEEALNIYSVDMGRKKQLENQIENEKKKPFFYQNKNLITKLETEYNLNFSNYNPEEYFYEIIKILNNNMPINELLNLVLNIDYLKFPTYKFERINEILTLYSAYKLYIEKARDSYKRIYENYTDLLGTGVLKDILSSGSSSEDFCLDEYQIALLRAKALVLHWERKTIIAEAVANYADKYYSNKVNESEYIKAWEDAKNAYYNSLALYEEELTKLNEIGLIIQNEQNVLAALLSNLQKEEEILNSLKNEYTFLSSLSINSSENFYYNELNKKYNNLLNKYRNFEKTGNESVYNDTLHYGLLLGLAQEKENSDINWQENLEPLVSLLKDYGYDCDSYFLPEVQDICESIINESEDFLNNTVDFLINFDKCFSSIPKWLETEIYNWKNAFIHYITTYAFSNNIKLETNSKLLFQLYNELASEYEDLFNYANSLNISEIEEEKANSLNTDLILILDRRDILDYKIYISQIWENTNDLFLEKNTHWRQSIKDEYFTNLNYLVCNISSWSESILFDSFFSASYYTNRLNDAFELYSQKILYNPTNDSSYYSFLYFNEYFNTDNLFKQLLSQHIDVLTSLNAYELSRLSNKELNINIDIKKEEIDAQENVYNNACDQYLFKAMKLLESGSSYDDQYSILKNAHTLTDAKRFEYEIQDAIQRWANSSYNISYKNEMEDSKIKLERARNVLNVLSDLFDNETYRSFNDPEYNLLYSSYKNSFNNKLTVFEVVETLYSNIKDEYINNENCFSNYKNYIKMLGTLDLDYSNYNLPEERSTWTGKDIIMVKDGRLAFTTDDSMNLFGINEAIANDLVNYFNLNISLGNEHHKTSQFEKAVFELNQRMSVYLSNPEKFKQWSLARDYIISSLIKANDDISFLNNIFSGYGELINNGSIGSELSMLAVTSSKRTLYSYINDKPIYKEAENYFYSFWNVLSPDEKADLEFYIILTITNSNGYSDGFSLVYTSKLYETVYNYVDKCYNDARKEANQWYNVLVSFIWDEVKSVNKNTLRRIEAPYKEINNKVSIWVNGLKNNFDSIKNSYSSYVYSCSQLDIMELVKSNGEKIVWDDINLTLLTANINENSINSIKTIWDEMQNELVNIEYFSTSDAFLALLKWTEEKEIGLKLSLNNYLDKSINTMQLNEFDFQTKVNDYISGNIDKNAIISSANETYGENTASWKTHYNNIHNVLLKNISMLLIANPITKSEFYAISKEMVSLTHDTIENRYLAEYKVREMEWQLMRNDLLDKYNEWQNSTSLIIEKGRNDWLAGKAKMEESYKQWYINFQNEYERINNEWSEVYLSGLEDKELWLEQAANAANHASSESLLSLIGTEGERLSRFVDTREPFGIRDSTPNAKSLLDELFQSSGITNMTKAFNSLINNTGIISPLVMRGMGGISAWDAASLKITASDLAKKTNSEIANNEAKILAFNVKRSINAAINGLEENVGKANKSFRENMDDLFIFKGLWSRSGNNYVKNIVKGSTLFTPVISKTVNIKGFENYEIGPIILQTNLEEHNLKNLNSLAINSLIENAYQEISKISSEIFGIDSKGERNEQSPGKFEIHIGRAPETKTDIGKKREDMFIDEGAGELGRLMCDFIYWKVIDCLGMGEVTLAPWDKRIWNDEGSVLTAPSLRSVGQIAGAVAATVVSVVTTPFTGGASLGVAVGMISLVAGISTTNDLIFGTLDAVYGYKTWDEAAFDIGKSYTINFVSGMLTAGFSGFGEAANGTKAINGITNTAVSAAKTTAGTIATQTLMAGVQTLTTGITTSILSGFTYSSEDGLGYSTKIASTSIKNTFTNSLVSMAGAFTSSSLTALNSGFSHLNNNKLKGFGELNQTDLGKLNGLAGSLVGQGVNYALGNDFTLNLLNFSLLSSNSSFNTGLLELHLGRDGTSMNFGTGGANVSIDNIAAVFRGAQVWEVNSNISKYIKNQSKEGGNGFDSYVTLRAQYGYGDNVQKDQLYGILKGDVTLNTNAEGDYSAQTTIDKENGNRVISLAGYQQGMSTEDQFRLAAILGHEAYRNGYNVGDTDSSGNIVTKTSQFNELKNASIARLAMGDRINMEHDWFYMLNPDFNMENHFLINARETGDYSMYDDYLRITYNNDEDYFFLSTATRGNYQNENKYSNIPLLNGVSQEKTAELNTERRNAAYEKYKSELPEDKKITALSQEDFEKDTTLLKDNGYKPIDFISLYNYGCRFMSAKYALEGLMCRSFDTLQLNEYAKKNQLYSNDTLLSNQNIADMITENTGGLYTIKTEFSGVPSIDQILELNNSQDMYFSCLKVPNGYGGDHFTMLSSIDITYDYVGRPTEVKINTANSWDSQGQLGKQSYSYTEITRWDIFKVTPTSGVDRSFAEAGIQQHRVKTNQYYK